MTALPPSLPLTYILPIRTTRGPDPELTGYLDWLGTQVADLIVVDGSEPEVFDRQHAAWHGVARHVPVAPGRVTPMGKVGGVLTGLDLAGSECVVLADDDIRYDRAGLAAVLTRLSTLDVVVPQNYFDPRPWHAVYETARVLLHRALDGDFPGTLGVRRSALRRCGGYAGDVMFENLELIRTVRAHGGRVEWDRSILVARRPPATRHFLGQRVRQAYDELARPVHLLAALLVLPLIGTAVARRRWPALATGVAVTAAVAETGRHRGGGAGRFPAVASALAPLWMVERGCCIWLALWWRLRGGVPYAGTRLKRAATSPRRLGRVSESWEG
jgi:hypothetical protein